MKSLFKIAALALSLVGVAFTSNAQTESATSGGERSGARLSVGPEVGLTTGKLSNTHDWSLGGSVQVDIPVVSNDLYITVNAGYNNIFGKGNYQDINLIPVKAGLKYFPVANFYVQGEAGASFLANKSDLGADNSAAFVYSPQIGYLFNLGGRNYIDAGVRFESNSKFYNGGNSSNFFGLKVAYAFGL